MQAERWWRERSKVFLGVYREFLRKDQGTASIDQVTAVAGHVATQAVNTWDKNFPRQEVSYGTFYGKPITKAGECPICHEPIFGHPEEYCGRKPDDA